MKHTIMVRDEYSKSKGQMTLQTLDCDQLPTNFKIRGDTLRAARRFKQSTRSLKAWRPRINSMRIGKMVIESAFRTAVDPTRNAVEAQGNFTARGLTAGNQMRRWHGTNRNCNIGDNGRTSLCYSPQCSLCCIIKSSFDMAHLKKKTGWGRFGNGIYTSSTSSKFIGYSLIITIVLISIICRSNDYSTNLVSSPWKAVLLSYVVVGKCKKFTADQPTLTQPPAGFDSVRSKSPSSFEMFCDCSVGHWRAQVWKFCEL